MHRLLLSESDSLFLTADQIKALLVADSVFQVKVREIYVPLGKFLAGRPDRIVGKIELDSVTSATKRYWPLFLGAGRCGRFDRHASAEGPAPVHQEHDGHDQGRPQEFTVAVRPSGAVGAQQAEGWQQLTGEKLSNVGSSGFRRELGQFLFQQPGFSRLLIDQQRLVKVRARLVGLTGGGIRAAKRQQESLPEP